MGKLRTHESKDVSDLAKEIVKKWKNEVDKAKSTASKNPVNGKQPGMCSSKGVCRADTGIARKPSTSVPPVPTVTANGKPEVRSAKVDGVKITTTGDNTRDRCAELIYDGLAYDSGARTSPSSHTYPI